MKIFENQPFPPKLRQITIPRLKRFPNGHYIYVYRNRLEPFYVGVGTNRRAWNQHYDYVEEAKGEFFNVLILRDGMYKESAHHLERKIILRYHRMGYDLVNRKIPCSI